MPRRTTQESIMAGLKFVFSSQEDRHWTDFSSLPAGSEIWVTAYVLARLADIPAEFVTRNFGLRTEESLDWLTDKSKADGTWGAHGELEGDADSTAWAVTARRRHGRKTAEPALEFIRKCQLPNGGFAAYPETSRMDGLYKLGSPETTVAALKALESYNPA